MSTRQSQFERGSLNQDTQGSYRTSQPQEATAGAERTHRSSRRVKRSSGHGGSARGASSRNTHPELFSIDESDAPSSGGGTRSTRSSAHGYEGTPLKPIEFGENWTDLAPWQPPRAGTPFPQSQHYGTLPGQPSLPMTTPPAVMGPPQTHSYGYAPPLAPTPQQSPYSLGYGGQPTWVPPTRMPHYGVGHPGMQHPGHNSFAGSQPGVGSVWQQNSQGHIPGQMMQVYTGPNPSTNSSPNVCVSTNEELGERFSRLDKTHYNADGTTSTIPYSGGYKRGFNLPGTPGQ